MKNLIFIEHLKVSWDITLMGTHKVVLLFLMVMLSSLAPANDFNVKDFGASGEKSENAQAAIQSAIDACYTAGGGRVYFHLGTT